MQNHGQVGWLPLARLQANEQQLSALEAAMVGYCVQHPIAGRAYFITNGEPIPCGELIGRMLEAAGLPRERRSVPPGIAYLAGWVLETIHHLGQRPEEPRMTRFLARQLSRAHHFDLSAARRDLGYEPEIGLDEGMARLAGSFAPAAQDG